MTPAQQILLSRVLPMLAATGLRYAVKQEDGTVIGDLALAPEKDPNKVYRPKVYDWIKSHDYQTVIGSIPVGGSHLFDSGAEGLGPKLQKPVTSYASQVFGPGNYITTVYPDKRTVEILRFA